MSKTNTGLVEFCYSKLGTAYVYGMKGSVLTLEKYNQLKKLYGSNVWDSDISKVSKVTVDCSGLISWYTGIQRGSTQFKNSATEVHSISTIDSAPIGALVWKQGHIGVYVGNGYYIAADGSAYGVRKNKLSGAKFTHWFLCSDITYVATTDSTTQKEDDEMVEKSKIIVNGKEVAVDRILKDGRNYIKITDIASALGYAIGNNGSIAVLTKK